MFFTTNFPKVNYLTLEGNTVTATDITKRFKFVDKVLTNKYILFNYIIKEGERPEVIADKYYNDGKLDWIILLTNKIVDPYFDWPLTSKEFNFYIKKRYESIPYAKTTYIKHYQIMQRKETTYDGFQVPERLIEVDANYYQTLPEEDRKRKTIYQHEYDLNESRKTIKIIEKSFIPQILEEVKKLYG